MDRTDKHTKLEIDLIEITKYIYLTLILCYTQASRLSNSRLGIFPITFVFSSPCSTVLAYISLIRSFFCPGISQTLRSHHTTLILSLSPHSSFHTNIMYFHTSMATTTTRTKGDFQSPEPKPNIPLIPLAPLHKNKFLRFYAILSTLSSTEQREETKGRKKIRGET